MLLCGIRLEGKLSKARGNRHDIACALGFVAGARCRIPLAGMLGLLAVLGRGQPGASASHSAPHCALIVHKVSKSPDSCFVGARSLVPNLFRILNVPLVTSFYGTFLLPKLGERDGASGNVASEMAE